MRRKDREITEQAIIREILEKSEICRIALNDDMAPYIVPLNYGFAEGALYFHSASAGRKIDLIRKNSRVCFEIEQGHEIIRHDQSCDWTARYRSVIGYGNIEIISGREEKIKGLDVIMSHNGKIRNTYLEGNIERIVILKLTIDSISGKQAGDW